MKGAKEWYVVRSKIAHPGKKMVLAERRREAFAKGLDIAEKIPFKPSPEGPFEKWEELVTAGTEV